MDSLDESTHEPQHTKWATYKNDEYKHRGNKRTTGGCGTTQHHGDTDTIDGRCCKLARPRQFLLNTMDIERGVSFPQGPKQNITPTSILPHAPPCWQAYAQTRRRNRQTKTHTNSIKTTIRDKHTRSTKHTKHTIYGGTILNNSTYRTHKTPT